MVLNLLPFVARSLSFVFIVKLLTVASKIFDLAFLELVNFQNILSFMEIQAF